MSCIHNYHSGQEVGESITGLSLLYVYVYLYAYLMVTLLIHLVSWNWLKYYDGSSLWESCQHLAPVVSLSAWSCHIEECHRDFPWCCLTMVHWMPVQVGQDPASCRSSGGRNKSKGAQTSLRTQHAQLNILHIQ